MYAILSLQRQPLGCRCCSVGKHKQTAKGRLTKASVVDAAVTPDVEKQAAMAGIRLQHTFLRLPQASPKAATVHTQASPLPNAFKAMQEDWR